MGWVLACQIISLEKKRFFSQKDEKKAFFSISLVAIITPP